MSLFGVEHPLWLAPMSGGPATVALAAAVAEAGGMGSLAFAYDTPEKIRQSLAEIRQRTKKPIAANLFAPAPLPPIDDVAVGRSLAALRPLFARHKAAGEPKLAAAPPFDFDAQLEVILEARVEVFSFTFGIPPPAALERVRRTGAKIVGTATTVAEARALVTAGVDAIIAQGAEAGGHRGSFLERTGLVGTIALVPQIVSAVNVPVIAAGGIMDGRGVAAALALGAQAVALGTAFMRTPEAATSPAHRAAMAESRDDSTVITRVFTGRPARGIENEFIRALTPIEGALPAFPLQHMITSPLRRAAAAAGDRELFHLWSGQGAPLGREMPAGELVRTILREAREAKARIAL